MTKYKQKILADVAFYLILLLLVFVVLCQLGFFPYRLVYVKSGSMAPVINTGDMAVVKIDSEFTPKVGDIILFTDQGDDVLHRTIEIDSSGAITTKGDFNNGPDLTKITQTKGRFLFSIPLLGYVVVFIRQEILWIITLIVFCLLVDILYKNRVFPFHKKPKGG